MRCLPYLLITSAVLICGISIAQTADGESPAEESVCDELEWATPGLYGLCVAFCEAQDCEPDFSAANPIEHCKPASRKILENYRKRMRPDDPDMPCLSDPCPCWSASDVPDYLQISNGFTVETMLMACLDTNICLGEITDDCAIQSYAIFGFNIGARIHLNPTTSDARSFPITPEERNACLALIYDNALEVCVFQGGVVGED